MDEIRNLGLLVGISLTREGTGLPATALEHGLLLNVTAGNVIRLLPPLIINEDQVLTLAGKLIATLNQWFEE